MFFTNLICNIMLNFNQRCGTVCLNSFGYRTSPSDNSNDRWKRLCLVSWATAPCVWMLRALTRNLLTYWLRSTVGRTPVFGQRTDPVLCSACSWWVTTMWVNCPLQVSQLGQLSVYPSGVHKWVVGLFIDACSDGGIWWVPTRLWPGGGYVTA